MNWWNADVRGEATTVGPVVTASGMNAPSALKDEEKTKVG